MKTERKKTQRNATASKAFSILTLARSGLATFGMKGKQKIRKRFNVMLQHLVPHAATDNQHGSFHVVFDMIASCCCCLYGDIGDGCSVVYVVITVNRVELEQ